MSFSHPVIVLPCYQQLSQKVMLMQLEGNKPLGLEAPFMMPRALPLCFLCHRKLAGTCTALQYRDICTQ